MSEENTASQYVTSRGGSGDEMGMDTEESKEKRRGTHKVSAPASNRLSTTCLRNPGWSSRTARWRGVAPSIRFIGSTSHPSCERMYSRTSVEPFITLLLEHRGGSQ